MSRHEKYISAAKEMGEASLAGIWMASDRPDPFGGIRLIQDRPPTIHRLPSDRREEVLDQLEVLALVERLPSRTLTDTRTQRHAGEREMTMMGPEGEWGGLTMAPAGPPPRVLLVLEKPARRLYAAREGEEAVHWEVEGQGNQRTGTGKRKMAGLSSAQ